MNYGEEIAYWYLRLNGFFPITNFVIHKSDDIDYSSDCDVLAIRPPFVYEPIGGQSSDWDEEFLSTFDNSLLLGVICEVKTGDYKIQKLFRENNVRYSIERLGFSPKEQTADMDFTASIFTNPDDGFQICKLLIAKNEPKNNEGFIFLPFDHARNFIVARVNKYPKEKWRDRMFINSTLFQNIIDEQTAKANNVKADV